MQIQGKKQLYDEKNERIEEATTQKRIPAALQEKELTERVSSIPVSEIPIDDIKSREINNFIISNIEELANSIESIGQQQEVILTTNTNGEYVMVAGHRRLEAIKYLRNKYKKLNNQEKVNKFSYIRARVLNSSEKELEEKVYLDTNTTTRIPTAFEALLGFDLKSMNFEDEEFLKKYLNSMYGKDGYVNYQNGNIKDRLNQNSLIRYLSKLIKEYFPTMETHEGTVKRYLILINNAHPELIKKILDGSISLDEATIISRYEKEKQVAIINGEIVDNIKTLNNEDKNIVVNTVMTYEKAISSIKKIAKNVNEINNYLQSINKKDITGNQKEIIKMLKNINEKLITISKMPTK